MAGSYFLSGPLPLAGGGNTVKFTQFTANGTWTKDANAQQVMFIIWNGGAGGGSGRQGATTSSAGGGGGSAGNVMIYAAPANMFSATETITIGAGGAGGVAQAANLTNGNPGTAGGQSLAGHMGPVLNGINGVSLVGGGGTTTSSSAVNYNVRISNVSNPATLSNFFYNGDMNAGSNSLISGAWDGSRGSNTAPVAASDIGKIFNNSYTQYTNYIYIAGYGGGGSGADVVSERAAGGGSNILNADQTVMFAGGAGGTESGTISGGTGANFVFPVTGAIFGGAGGGGGGGQHTGGSAGTGGNGGIPGGEIWVYEILG